MKNKVFIDIIFCISNNFHFKTKPKMNENYLKSKSYSFVLDSINLFKVLNSKKEYIMSKQLLRSVISIGANIREAKQCSKLS
jgi:hypothetical protein